MSKFDAAMVLGLIGFFALFFLWVYGLTTGAPKAIRIMSRIVNFVLVYTLAYTVVYCILILVR